MPRAAGDVAIVLLAGGEASRFPGKLETDAGGVPLIVRVYRNVRPIGPVYLSVNTPMDEAIARELDCEIVADARPGRGPLGGLVSVFERAAEARVFAIAGDAPLVDATVLSELLAAWEDNLQAVVPERGGRLEPLCALYDRAAFLNAAKDELQTGSGSVAAVAKSLRHKVVRLANEDALRSINTPEDREAILEVRA